jgi:mono/diheme cytochrome c family protein
MRRTALALATLIAAIGIAAAGCGGEEEATPSPETVTGTTTTPSTTTASTSTETTPGPTGNATAGKAVFTGSAGCTGCHTLADAGSTGTVGPNLDDAMPDDALVVDRVTNGKGVMPSFKGTLTPQQIADVAAYVSSVAGK